MVRLALCVLVGTMFAGLLTVGYAQQDTSVAKTSTNQLTAEVCKAIEGYVARIDAARSIKEKDRREERYRQALESLTAVLKSQGETGLLAEAAQYAQFCEIVVSSDPTNPQFDVMVDKRLKTRSKLLQPCEGYTSTR